VGENLRKARLMRCQTQKEASKTIWLEHVSYNRWECNKNEVDIKYMPKVKDYLGYKPIIQEALTLGGKRSFYNSAFKNKWY
jgi:DNA-binding XRE family transcriptional regulator